MTFLRWLKSKYPQWHDQGVINLAGSGTRSADSILLRHLVEHQEKIRAVLKRDHDAQYGQPEYLEHIRRREALPAEVGILPAHGASSALTMVYQALLRGEPGSRVLVESPAYDPLVQIPQYLGAAVDRFPRPVQQAYAPDLAGLASRITPHTRLVVLTNLHNPSGQSLSTTTLQDLVQTVANVNPKTRILIDETFAGFLGPSHRSAAATGEPFISLASLTKVYGLSTLRAGWIAASGETFEMLKEAWLQMQNIGSRFAEAMACVVFEHIEEYETQWQSIIRANRPVVSDWREKLADRIELDLPAHGCICFPRLRGIDVDALFALAESSFKVVFAPGRFFDAPEHFRIGFGGDTGTLEEGLNRLSNLIATA